MKGKLPTQTYHQIPRDKVDFEYLRNKLKLKHLKAKQDFAEKYPHADKFLREKGLELGKIREHSAKVLSAGALTGTLLFGPPSNIAALPSPLEILKSISDEKSLTPILPQKELIDALKEVLPTKVRALTRDEEKTLEQIFDSIVGIKSRASLEGEHLNTTYGLIGAEQHLRRYPGDSLYEHGQGTTIEEGIAPGLGAWGYFAPSKSALNSNLEDIEKWYAVVQTLYLPDWAARQPYLRDWYKYRKVLIVNTQNGNAVIAAIADSGPAMWTGKVFGGSPEVMEYLGGHNYKKGPVVLFFVDDPENKVPLGPVEYNKTNLLNLVMQKT